ncbi:MAG: histidine triad nucleotide-binding protein [Bacillota bacterium]
MSDCLFCRIVKGDIPCEFVYKDERVVAFRDINPVAPVHILIIPIQHIQSVIALNKENAGVVADIFVAAQQLAEQMGLDKNGFRIVTNTGKDGGQTVEHLHYHLLGGRSLQWPPG